jgi:hypothetical protein
VVLGADAAVADELLHPLSTVLLIVAADRAKIVNTVLNFM